MIIDFIVMNAIFRAELLELVAQLQCEWGALGKSSRRYGTGTRFILLALKISCRNVINNKN